MEEGLTKLIFRVGVTILLVSAIAVFLTLYFKTQSVTRLIQDDLINPIAITDKSTGNKENFISGAQIVSSIMNGLETDINVDGSDILKTVDIYNFNYDLIDASAKYDIAYVIDTGGVITKVRYQKKP